MSIRFPTRPMDDHRGGPLRGEPLRARACRCGVPDLDLDGLCSCGYWPKRTVDETWERQAKITGWRGPVSSLDAYRKAIYERQFGAAA